MEKLIAIDGNSLMYRAFFAISGMNAKDGTPTGAIYGFMSMLLKLLNYSPTHMAVAFDVHAPTFRHKQYDGYKAGRPETPQELVVQFNIMKKLLRKMEITVIECEGYEADDILGTLSRRGEAAGMDVLLVTGDKDALQLVTEHTHIIFTKKGATDITEYDIDTLHERYGLKPAQMVDLKGLMGDSSDNLPGVKGVGEKTALKLLEKYGTLEETLTRGAVEENGALQARLTEYADDARLSYFLGTINTDAPIDTTLDDLLFRPERMANAIPEMSELQLKTTIARLPKSDVNTAVRVRRDYAPVETVVLDNEDALRKLLAENADATDFAYFAGDRVTIAFSADKQYEFKKGETLFDVGLDVYEALKMLVPVFEDEKIHKLVYDAKTLMHRLSSVPCEFKGLTFDACIADYLLNAVNPSKELKDLTDERGVGEPCACALFRLRDDMMHELEEKQLISLYNDVELPLIDVLYDMEITGFCVDREKLHELGKDFSAKRDEAAKKVYDIAGFEFNLQSPKQLSDVLFSRLMLPPPKQKTKLGYSTSADVLETYELDYPIVKYILEYRFYAKLMGTFIDGMLSQTDRETSRIHTTFNQNVTATGRISSTEPNLQTIPTRTEAGREIRRAFVAGEGNMLLDADYSQIELRVLAHMSDDATMKDAFIKGMDIHARTASEVFDTPLSEVTREQRGAAKAVNFGIVYGISDFGLAKQLGIPRKLAGEYIRKYLERYEGIDRFMKEEVKKAETLGYASTLSGRRRDMFELKSSNFNTRAFGKRIAMNMPVQGTAADIIKIAMVNVFRRLKEKGFGAKLVLQIHDELIVDTPKDEIEEVKVILQECMEKAFALSVPLIAEVNVGRSWYDTK